MSTQPPSPDGVAEVVRLTGLLSDQVLDAQIMGRPIPDQDIRALLKASLLLQECGAPLPPLLQQIIHEVGKSAGQMPRANANQEVEQASPGRLAWLLRAFQGAKG